jgi:hypothetical protein
MAWSSRLVKPAETIPFTKVIIPKIQKMIGLEEALFWIGKRI